MTVAGERVAHRAGPCRRKIVFATEALAVAALAAIATRRENAECTHPETRLEDAYYRCRFCPGWHLTHDKWPERAGTEPIAEAGRLEFEKAKLQRWFDHR